MSIFRRRSIGKFEGDGSYDFEIVGELHYQDNLQKIVGPKTPDGHEHYCEALLQPEPTNPYDSNAVVVRIANRTVGYLPRSTAAAYRSRSSDPMKADAVIVGGWLRKSGSEGHFGVKLDIS